MMYDDSSDKKYNLSSKTKNGVEWHWQGGLDTDIVCYLLNSRWPERWKAYVWPPGRYQHTKEADSNYNIPIKSSSILFKYLI